jgi:predicted amidohydrolase
MPHVLIGMLKTNKAFFGKDASNRMNEFRLSVLQADSILKAYESTRPGIRMLIAPEYYWSGYAEVGTDRYPQVQGKFDKRSIYNNLKVLSSQAGDLVIVAGSIFYRKLQGDRSIARNVCPVLRNGHLLLKLYKEFDDGAAGKNQVTHDPKANASEPYFVVDNVVFGLEICGEHTEETAGAGLGGRLKRWNTGAGNNIVIDVHILIADSSSIKYRSVVARAGGFLVYCDIDGGHVAVFPSAGPHPVGAAPLQQNPYPMKKGWKGADSPAASLQPINKSLPQVNGASLVYFDLNV